jgi:hypothetical protein
MGKGRAVTAAAEGTGQVRCVLAARRTQQSHAAHSPHDAAPPYDKPETASGLTATPGHCGCMHPTGRQRGREAA